MRKQASWLILLALAGCQLTHLVDDKSSTSEVTSPPTTAEDANAASKNTSATETKTQTPAPTPQEQTDLWKRISMQFNLSAPADNKTVNYYRRWYINHPKHLAIVAKRAEPFLYLITEKIEQNGLPLELTLLPIVESSFDIFAYSYGRAAGIWQFVPSTGKLYGLKQNYWYDGRRDINAATDAAVKYLSYLGKTFDGNWEQAIAAYNAGSGTVLRAIRKNKKRHQPTDFFSLNLPKETTGYVPKLLALADVVAHQEKYGISIPKIANKPVLAQVELDQQIDLALAAKYAGISIQQIQTYNPGFNRWATLPDGSYTLLLPLDKVAPFNTALKTHEGDGIKLVRYQVKSGDNLISIAKKYHTTPGVIRTANNMRNNLIRINQYLMIPTSVTNEKKYTLSVANRLAKIQQRARGQYKLNHTVTAGESFWTIAKKYKVSHAAIAKWNGMSPRDPLKIGKHLVIWKSSKNGAVIRSVFYQVRKGDTISDIAAKFKVRTTDIIQWNHLKKQKYLKPGQQLKLYVDVTKVSV